MIVLTGRYRFQLYLILLIVFTVILAVASLRSFSHPPQLISNQDKLGHFMAYAFTSWLACQVLRNYLKGLLPLFLAFMYASVTGAVLEYLQAQFTTTRQGEWADIVANLIGALTGCVIFSLRHKAKSGHEHNASE